MRKCNLKKGMLKVWVVAVIGLMLSMILTSASYADDTSGEKLYSQLSRVAKGTGDTSLFKN